VPQSTGKEYFSLLATELRTKAQAHRQAVSMEDQAALHSPVTEEERKFAPEEEDLVASMTSQRKRALARRSARPYMKLRSATPRLTRTTLTRPYTASSKQ
jgi:hypothetical protein